MKRMRLGDILLNAGVIRREQVETALRHQERWGGQLGQILVNRSFISEAVLVRALSSQLGIDVVELAGLRIPPDVLQMVPADLAREHRVVPFRQQGSVLDLAMANPLDLGITDELRIRTRLTIRPFIAGERAVQEALALCYGTSIPVEIVRAEATDVTGAEVVRLQERVVRLEGLLGRNENVLRKVLRLLVEKDIASREEILAAIR